MTITLTRPTATSARVIEARDAEGTRWSRTIRGARLHFDHYAAFTDQHGRHYPAITTVYRWHPALSQWETLRTLPA